VSPALLKIKTPVYAFQARDGELAAWAVEIRERAALRLGELNAEGPKARGGRPPKKLGTKILFVGPSKMSLIWFFH